MAEKGREPGFQMGAEHRTKIKNSKVLSQLIRFAEGEDGVDMKPHQVTAALGLLKKVMPDLQSTTVEGSNEDGSITLRVHTGVPRD